MGTKPYVVAVGASNLDLQGFSKNNIVLGDSNPGRLDLSAGGASRNIAENLVRMSTPTFLLSVLSDDLFSEMVITQSRQAGINMDEIFILPGRRGSAYLSITNTSGNMYVALSDTSLLKEMPLDYLEEKKQLIKGAGAVVTDPSCSKAVMQYLAKTYITKDMIVDTVSTSYAAIIKPMMGYFHTIKASAAEAEVLSGYKIKNLSDIELACSKILSSGTKRVFITHGKNEVFFAAADGTRIRRMAKANHVISATGAGDAFTAGIVYAYLNRLDVLKTIDFALTASVLTTVHQKTVNPNLSVNLINQSMKECVQ